MRKNVLGLLLCVTLFAMISIRVKAVVSSDTLEIVKEVKSGLEEEVRKKTTFFEDEGIVTYRGLGNIEKELSTQKNKLLISINSNSLVKGQVNDVFVMSYYDDNGIVQIHELSTTSVESEIVADEIVEFYNEKIGAVKECVLKNNTSSSVSEELFSEIKWGTKRVLGKPYGYMDHTYTIKKYRASNVSSLFLIETQSSFTPGAVAYVNGDSTYSYWAFNKSGYVHVLAQQEIEELDQGSPIRYGGVPKPKDFWPINAPGSITISSTYNIGFSLGFSYKNGFSLKNLTSPSDSNIGIDIGYSYSKSYTTTEPALSAQRDSNNPDKFQWSYSYHDAKKETHHLYTGYLFEMNNGGHGLIGENRFTVQYNFKMSVADTITDLDIIRGSVTDTLNVWVN